MTLNFFIRFFFFFFFLGGGGGGGGLCVCWNYIFGC